MPTERGGDVGSAFDRAFGEGAVAIVGVEIISIPEHGGHEQIDVPRIGKVARDHAADIDRAGEAERGGLVGESAVAVVDEGEQRPELAGDQ